MKVKEAKQIVASCELSEGAMNRANELLTQFGDDETEMSDDQIDQIVAIIDVDIDTDKMLLKANEDVTVVLSGLIGETKQSLKIAGDQMEATVKGLYKETADLVSKANGSK